MTGGEVGVGGGGATAGCPSGLPLWVLPSGADTVSNPPGLAAFPPGTALPGHSGVWWHRAGPGGEKRHLRAGRAGCAPRAAAGRDAPPFAAQHRPSLPRRAGAATGAAAGVLGAAARGAAALRLPLPVRCHPRTLGRGCAWMPGPGWAAPVTCTGAGREDGDELSPYLGEAAAAAVPGAG